MGYLIKMPQMGLEMEQGEVVAWEVDPGDVVESGTTIAVVESEKAANDVEARADGTVREIIVPEGGVVEPGTPIGIFGDPDEDISELREEAASLAAADEASAEPSTSETTSTSETNATSARAQSTPNGASATTETPSTDDSATDSTEAAPVRATPGARSLAEEHGVTLSAVDGTGPQGTITEADVKEAVDDRARPADEDDRDSQADVRATPGAKRLATDRQVDLGTVDGTGPQGVITEGDVENHAGAADGRTAAASGSGSTVATQVRASPGARRRARQTGVDLTAVEGTGPHGVIIEDDVENHIPADPVGTGAETDAAPAPDDGPASRTVVEVQERSGMQQTVGNRMEASYRNAPHVTLNRSIDTTALRNVKQAASNEGVDVSVTDLLLAGFGAQLAEMPAFNALYEDGDHKLVEEVNIGVAVDVEDGLVTPVVPSVTTKSVEGIAAVRQTRTERALSGNFQMSDMDGGTFTVSNLGMFGIDSFDPIINPPEVAILGVGRIRDDGTMTLSLSFDHRVVNGADAARFLDGAVGNLTDAKWLADQFDADIVGALIDLLSQ